MAFRSTRSSDSTSTQRRCRRISGRCSGSLLDRTTFLTAGHCTDAPAVGARVYFQQDAGANYDPVTQYDPVSGYPDECLDRSHAVDRNDGRLRPAGARGAVMSRP